MSESSPATSSPAGRRGGAGDRPARSQGPGGHSSSLALPWAGDPRAEDKSKILRLLLENPEGLPLARLASLLAGATTGDSGGRDYSFARRFTRNCEHFRTIDKSAGSEGEDVENARSVWVEPRASAFTCLCRKQQVSPTEKPQEGTAIASPTDRKASESPTKFAKDRARAYLSRHLRIGSDATRRGLASELAAELRSIEGRVSVLERTSTREGIPEYLLIPYKTRFNDSGRASESRQAFAETWSEAGDSHSSAVMATLTTDPSLHSSAIEAADALTDTLQMLRRWLARDVSSSRRVGRKLPYLSALEWTDTGLPHLHVVFFGARSLCSQAALSRYLSDRTGRVVWMDSLSCRGGRWTWSNPSERPDDASAATQPREYLSEALRGQQALAGMNAEGASEALDDVDTGLWKQALYWASGKQLWTSSQGLQASVSGDRSDRRAIDRGLPHVPQYRFVGVSYYEDLPGHVQRAGELLGRPPPSASSASTTSPGT